ncbi:hypothetical protein MRB53_039123 [Persea americana]|nr:hypothetical protein MRB53_039123 [Persea americana]
MVAVGRCPRQTALHERRDDLVDIVGAVELVRVLAGDQIAVQHDQLLRFVVKDLIDDLDGVDVLLRTPRVPRVCDRQSVPDVHTSRRETRVKGCHTLSEMQILEDGDLKSAILGETQRCGEVRVALLRRQSGHERARCEQCDGRHHDERPDLRNLLCSTTRTSLGRPNREARRVRFREAQSLYLELIERQGCVRRMYRSIVRRTRVMHADGGSTGSEAKSIPSCNGMRERVAGPVTSP